MAHAFEHKREKRVESRRTLVKPVRRTSIYLDQIYDLVPSSTAAHILHSILINYEMVKPVLYINFSPDVGMIVYTPRGRELERAEEYEREIGTCMGVKDEYKCINEIAHKVAKKPIVIKLFDGYELAYGIYDMVGE